MNATPQGRWLEYPKHKPRKSGLYPVIKPEEVCLGTDILFWLRKKNFGESWFNVIAFYSIPIPPYQPKGDKHGKT